LAGAAVWWAVRAIRREEYSPFAPYFLAAEAHIVCDWMTSFGTPLLWPFSSSNFSLDWVSNLSLGPLLILAAGLFAIKVWRRKGDRLIPLLWATLGMFLVFSVVLHSRALAYARPGDKASALPDLINPLRWRVIDEDRSAGVYQVYSVRPLFGESLFLGAYPLPSNSPWIAASRSDARVQRFLRNDRWPVAWVVPHEKGATVEWGNLLFFWSGRLRGKLVVELDENGHVVSATHNRGVWK
jgi:hypothetical protein